LVSAWADPVAVSDVLDMTVVEELLSLSDEGDPELLLDLIQLFLADGPSKLESIVAGLQSGDLDRMERAAHSLKGSSGNLGARRLQAACERMQVASRSRDLELARDLAALVQRRYEEVRRVLVTLQRRYT
jgi:HPt (histidine-containing phosphotransfer) domain-containing protein